jgi:hypothetical protein
MAKFRKKPVVVEAYCYDQKPKNYRPDWLTAAIIAEKVTTFPEFCNIWTLEGTMRCDLGDWIIQGVHGELYPCKPDIFAATYEPA